MIETEMQVLKKIIISLLKSNNFKLSYNGTLITASNFLSEKRSKREIEYDEDEIFYEKDCIKLWNNRQMIIFFTEDMRRKMRENAEEKDKLNRIQKHVVEWYNSFDKYIRLPLVGHVSSDLLIGIIKRCSELLGRDIEENQNAITIDVIITVIFAINRLEGYTNIGTPIYTLNPNGVNNG
mgnify:CR=1 FL=1